jgi:non-heme chloroperoxidase
LEASTIASSHFFTTSDGVRLHYLEKGSGPPLIMLPGWTQPASRFAAQLKALSNNFRCLALDFRGHGESERPDHGYRVSRLAKDCLDFLDHLGLQDAVLLGHSAGCTVIWSFIDLFGQDRIRALVFSDEMIALVKRPEWSEAECRKYGASLGGDEVLAMAAAIVGSDGEQVMHNFISSMFSPGFPTADIAGIIEDSLKVPRSAAAKLMLSVMHSDYRDLLPLIRRPTLCIGGIDSHLGPEVMPWIASQIPGAKVLMINTRHFVHLENPVEFNNAVRVFLEEINSKNSNP